MSPSRAALRAAVVSVLLVSRVLPAGAQNPLKPRPYGLGTTTADSLRYFSDRLMSQDPTVVSSAFTAVESMGKRAESLAGGISLLTTHLDPEVRARAAHTLTVVAAPEISVPALRDLCADTTQAVREASYEAIGRIGPAARSALPRLRRGAAATAPEERAVAERAITAVRAGATKAKPGAVAGADAAWIAGDLRAVSPIMRRLAADGLAEMGTDARSAAPALVKSLGDGDASVRLKSARALLVAAPEAKTTREALLARVADSTEVLEARVEIARRTRGSDPALRRPIEERLLGQLESHDDGVRYAAASLLGEMQPPLPESVTALAAALEDPSQEVRVAAANSLGSIGPEARDALPALKAAVRGTDPRLRMVAEISIARVEQ